MKRILKYILFFLTLTVSVGLQAHNDAGSNPTYIRYYLNSSDNLFFGYLTDYDTLLSHSVFFDELDQPFTLFNTLTNYGLAHKNMRFSYDPDFGFDLSIPSFNQFLKNKDNTKYIVVDKPLTDIQYTMGFDKEQRLNVTFAEPLFKRCQFSANYNTDYSPGIYLNSKAQNTTFDMNIHYASASDLFGVSAYYFINKLQMQENGGITDLSDIFNTSYNRGIIHINLQNASNTVKSSGIGLNAYIKTPNCKNNTEQDTLEIKPIANLFKARLSYSFDFQKNQIYFNETSVSSSFYAPFDTALYSKTFDTIGVYEINNSLMLSNFITKDQHFYYNVGINLGTFRNYGYFDYEAMISHANDTISYDSYRNSAKYSQMTLFGGIRIKPTENMSVIGNGNLILAGYQAGDVKINGQFNQQIKSLKLRVDVEYRLQSASWFQTEYYSNHFRWSNSFDRSSVFKLDAEIGTKNITLGVKHTSIDNYIYFNTLAKPEQTSTLCNVEEVYTTFDFNLNRFDFVGFASLQKSTNDVIRVPLAMGKLKFSYTFPYANGAALIQPGIVISYFTKYYADAYMPATRVFYLQNSQQIGNCPFIDAYVAIQIKKANLYLKYSNANTLPNYWEHFTTPTYPMRDACLYFGVNWRLYN